jgi:stress response protein YsnF
MHEKLVIERRPDTNDLCLYSNNTSSKLYNEIINPIETKIQIKIPLKREEVEVIKKPCIKEVIVKKNQYQKYRL